MAKEVDQKVVEMRFDNQNFEKNVSKSMTTIEKLKNALKFDGATKGIEDVERQVNSIRFGNLTNTIENLADKFSGLEAVATLTFYRIAQSAADTAISLVKSLSTDNIIAGWQKLEDKTTSVATLVAQGNDISTVKDEMEKLNWFTDETSYNFNDMLSSISKFTASGKGLSESVTAVQGIALWAAQAGQNATTASNAMYQLSQALSSGYMRKEDWKSIQNANMDTDAFRQKALDTAVALGTLKKNADDTYTSLVNDEGSFTKSQFADHLTQDAWFTSDVMMEVWEDYSKAADDIYSLINTMSDEFDVDLIAGNVISAADALAKGDDEFQKFIDDADMAPEAAAKFRELLESLDPNGIEWFRGAQEYRKFSDIIEATQEAVRSKWSNVFESITGDYYEQRELWATIGDEAYDIFATPIDKLSEKMAEWKELGGRDALLSGLGNLYKAITAIIDPIKEAFRDIFPESTAESLVKATEKFKEFTAKLIISDETGEKIKNTFKGLFAVLKTAINVVSTIAKAFFNLLSVLAPLGSGILTVTGYLGKWLNKTTETIRNSNTLSKVLNTLSEGFKTVTSKVSTFLKETLKFDKIVNFFKSILTVIAKMGAAIGKAFGNIVKNGDLNGLMSLINGGLLAGILKGLNGFVKNLTKATSNLKSFGDSAVKILDQVKDVLKAWQKDIQAKTLLKIAGAVAILVGSLYVLSAIPSDKLGSALGAMAATMTELLVAFKILMKISDNQKILARTSLALISMSLSLLIVASAIKKLSSLSFGQIVSGLAGLAGAMTIMIVAMKKMPDDKKMFKIGASLIVMSTAMVILASALRKFGSLSITEIGKGLLALAGSLIILVAALNKLPNDSFKKTSGLLLMSTSMVILASALKKMGSMSWSEIARSLTAMGGAMLILTVVMNKMPTNKKTKDSKTSVVSLIGMTTSMVILATALNKMAQMSWSDIARALTAMGGALLELTVCMALMSKFGTASGPLLAASAAIVVLSIGLKSLAKMSIGDIVKSLTTLAAAFIIIGVAGNVLKTAVQPLLALAGAMALFGLGTVALGAGLLLIAAGISALAVALGAGAAAIVGGLSAIIIGILELIPQMIGALSEAIVALCDCIMIAAPKIAETILVVIYETLKELAEYTPMIVNALMDFLIDTIRALADRAPELIVSLAELVNAIFSGFVQALQMLDPKTAATGIACVGALVGIMYLMSGLGELAGPAAIGILAFGGLVVELAAILAAIGALNKIPGLKDFVDSGGDLLLSIGTAIGKFIGGIIGGIGAGISASLPDIATNLSTFMKNLEGFIEGANNIKPDLVIRIGSLSGAIMALSAAQIVDGIARFLTLGGSLPNLGTDLSDFMNNAKDFIAGADKITPSMAQGVSAMAGAIVAITGANVLNGIVSIFTLGLGSLGSFGKQLGDLGSGMNDFVTNLGDFDESDIAAVSAACDAIVKLAEASKKIPNSGGLAGLFAGENDVDLWGIKLPVLALGLTAFMKNLGEFTDSQVSTAECAANVIAVMAEAANKIPNTGGLVSWFSGDNDISSFAGKLPAVGTYLSDFITNLGTFGDDAINTAKCAAEVIAGMAEAANTIPNTGGLVSWFSGDNDISTFAEKLPSVGTYLSDFIDNVGSFDESTINTAKCAANVIAKMAAAANKVPNTGGLAGWFKGDNDILLFAAKLPGVGTYLGDFIDNVGSCDESTVNTANCAANVIAKMAEAANNVPNTGSLVGWFTGEQDITQFTAKLPGVAGYLSDFIDNVGSFDDETINTAQCAANVIATMAEAANNVPNTGGLKSWFSGDNDISTFASKLPSVATYLKEFISNLGTFGEDQIATAECGANSIKALAEAANNIPNTGGLKSLFSGDNDISKFASKFGSVGTGLKEYITNIGTFGEQQVATVEASTKALNAIVSAAKLDVSKAKTNVDGLGDVATSVVTFIKKMKSTSKDDMELAKSNADGFKELVTTFNEVNGDNIKSMSEGLKTAGETAVTNFVNAFSGDSPKTKISQAIRDLMDKIVTTAESKRSDIKSKFESLAQSAVDTISSSTMIAKMNTAGKNFAQGFADGITENKYLATKAGTTLGNAAYEAARKAIDAHSPSKKAFKLGSYFGIGFVNGINEYESDAYGASSGIAEQAKKGLASAISAVDNILDGGNNAPTIRPVLDLSDVEDGASTIASMFNNPRIGSNLNAISVGMSKRSNSNEEVVSAINKLKDGISGGGDTYNINGITVDEQSAVSEAVQTIIRAVTVDRRT